jgi:hypothetical protein
LATTRREVVLFLSQANLERKNPRYYVNDNGPLRAVNAEGLALNEGSCVYVTPNKYPTEPSCIAGYVFAQFAGDLLESLRDDTAKVVSDVWQKEAWKDRFETTAWEFLSSLQDNADTGVTWAKALHDTLRSGH